MTNNPQPELGSSSLLEWFGLLVGLVWLVAAIALEQTADGVLAGLRVLSPER